MHKVKKPHPRNGVNKSKKEVTLYRGDCMKLLKDMPDESVHLTLTSPPYCMGKEYDSSRSLDDFVIAHSKVLPEIVRVTKTGGHICWQVGYHVRQRVVAPLDIATR